MSCLSDLRYGNAGFCAMSALKIFSLTREENTQWPHSRKYRQHSAIARSPPDLNRLNTSIFSLFRRKSAWLASLIPLFLDSADSTRESIKSGEAESARPLLRQQLAIIAGVPSITKIFLKQKSFRVDTPRRATAVELVRLHLEHVFPPPNNSWMRQARDFVFKGLFASFLGVAPTTKDLQRSLSQP